MSVGHHRVGHDRRGVGIDEHDLVAARPQRLAGLRAGIVEFARLADNDGPRSDNQYLVNSFAFHLMNPFESVSPNRGCIISNMQPDCKAPAMHL